MEFSKLLTPLFDDLHLVLQSFLLFFGFLKYLKTGRHVRLLVLRSCVL